MVTIMKQGLKGAALAFVMLNLTPVTAWAEKQKIFILPVAVEVKVSQEEKQVLAELYESSLAEGLKNSYDVYYGDVVKKALKEEFSRQASAGSCSEDVCFQNLAIHFQAELMAQVKIQQLRNSYFLNYKLLNPMDKRIVDASTAKCEQCSPDSLLEDLKDTALDWAYQNNDAVVLPQSGNNSGYDYSSEKVIPKGKRVQKKGRKERIILPEMKLIPRGEFSMGCVSNENCQDSELPVTVVKVRPFKLSTTEVTFSQYDQCSKEGVCHEAEDEGWGRGKMPVINVNVDDAKTYIAWLNKRTGKRFRLPSEAEWEYAARAGSKEAYIWGDSVGCDNAHYGQMQGICGNEISTSRVAIFPKNTWGLHDMFGNTWEWVADCWNDDHSGRPKNATVRKTGQCDGVVLRGGGWSSEPWILRSAERQGADRNGRGVNIGFRLAE